MESQSGRYRHFRSPKVTANLSVLPERSFPAGTCVPDVTQEALLCMTRNLSEHDFTLTSA